MDQQVFNQSSSISSSSETITPSTQVIYSGFMRRLAAVLIDAFFTGILTLILGSITGHDFIISLSVSAIVGIIYTTIFDSSELMGTPGKAMLGIAVVTESDQKRISFQSAVLRFLCKYISTFILMLGYIIQPFTDKRQTFHDMASNTLVIKRDSGQLSYWKCFKDNFNKIINN